MFYIATCTNEEYCGWSGEILAEEHDDFDFQCPDCCSVAVISDQKTIQEGSDGFLLPYASGEATDTEDEVE